MGFFGKHKGATQAEGLGCPFELGRRPSKRLCLEKTPKGVWKGSQKKFLLITKKTGVF